MLGLTEEEGGFAGDPVLGVVKQMDLGFVQGATEIYVGLLAATILFLATNAGIIGVSRLVYSMGIHRQMPDALRRLHPRFRTPWIGILVFSGAAIVLILPGQETLLGSVYSFGALLSFTIAHASVARLRATRPDARAALPRPVEPPDRELRRAGVRARRRRLHRDRLRGDRRAQPRRSPRSAPAGCSSAWSSTRGTAAARGSTYVDAQGGDRAAGRRPRGGVRLGARPRGRRHARRAADRDRRQARRPQAARHPRAGDDHGAERLGDRRGDARRRGRRGLDHRAGQAPGRRARLRALGEGPRRPGRAPDHRGGTGHARGRRRHDRARARLRRLGVRQDDRDGAGGAPVPRDHRVAARARAAEAPKVPA